MRSKGTNTKALDGAQICSIIESCSKYGVTKLQFGDLHLELGPQAEPAGPGASTPEFQPPDAKMSEIQKQEELKDLEAQSVRLREDELAEKLLTDPEGFEEMLQQGDIDDADEPGDEE
jgi:hypothetical protein